jgi:hypothetical protein
MEMLGTLEIRWRLLEIDRDWGFVEIQWRDIGNPNARLSEDLSGGQAEGQMTIEAQMSKPK